VSRSSLASSTGTRPQPTAMKDLAARYDAVRAFSGKLCAPLEIEDYVVQSMPDVSPTRWHLAHTTWFFETFVLSAADGEYKPFHPAFAELFNSYYNAVGPQFPRSRRGLLTRPTVKEVFAYRAHVDEHVRRLLDDAQRRKAADVDGLIELGLHHEQQHQELMLTDLKHVLAQNPLFPVYRAQEIARQTDVARLRWGSWAENLRQVGFEGDGFCYDNELPRHRVFVEGFELANRPVTNAEYLEFIESGGYRQPVHWLSEGWAAVQQLGWQAPLYWTERDGSWWNFTLSGQRPVNPAEPVCHVSLYEADAFARWAGYRLPTEAEWETAVSGLPFEGAFVEDDVYHPQPAPLEPDDMNPKQMFGNVWEWTASPYAPYPGYQPPKGAIGEYNGKFMCSQFVLRGGSCATSRTHIRATYRNFFYPADRWQFTGIRLAR
jgi:ergothioneine biosynthesis protein EgtB